MNGIWRHITLLLSRLLDSQEREIALGDIAELKFGSRRALTGMLGLVVRRQLAPWKQTRAWSVLFVLVVPQATLLAFSSNNVSAQLFPTLVMWLRHHGTYSTGVTPGAEALGYFLEVAAIMLGSWTCGFAAGTLSPATRCVNGLLFLVILIVAMNAPLTPFAFISFCCSPWGLLPVIMACLFILLPAIHGLRSSVTSKIKIRGLLLLSTTMGVVGVLVAWVQGWGSAAMENWSRAGSALTVLQLLKSELAWFAPATYRFGIVLLVSPALFLLFVQTRRVVTGPRARD